MEMTPSLKEYLMSKKLTSVLLIDDDEPTNFFNQMIVEDSGCAQQVKAIQSGEEALEYLSSISENDSSPDLIFLDINMPAMNGWEFLEQYKKLHPSSKGKVMVVMLTTSLFPEDKSKAEETPEVSGFENKPLTPEKLERILKQYFGDEDPR
jgi:CheY-like chemotaxis protein